jgi:hypothetical protein
MSRKRLPYAVFEGSPDATEGQPDEGVEAGEAIAGSGKTCSAIEAETKVSDPRATLMALETLHKSIILYMWMGQRMPVVFSDLEGGFGAQGEGREGDGIRTAGDDKRGECEDNVGSTSTGGRS